MKRIPKEQRSVIIITLVLFALTISHFAFAENVATEENPPQEAPYIQEESEFGKTTQWPVDVEKEIKDSAEVSAEPLAPATTPQVQTPTQIIRIEEPIPQIEEIQIPATPKMKEAQSLRKDPRKGIKYIEHPMAAKGLIKIEKDGTYIYKTDDISSSSKTGTVRFGSIKAPEITAKDGATSFSDMYEGPNLPYVMFDYEWQPFTSFGRLGLQLGAGLIYSQGNGRFSSPSTVTAKERYSFIAIPMTLGALYRVEWAQHQWIAPYVSGGGAFVAAIEARDDNSSPHGVGVPGIYGAGGMLFNITAMDRMTAFTLRKEYGISNLWLSSEFRILKTFKESVSFSSDILSLGIGVDY